MSRNTQSDFDEFNTAITRVVENAALHALTIVHNPEKWFIAIPFYIQRVMVRHYRRMSMTPSGNIATNENTIFTDFMGFKVIPGYKMKIVVFHPDAAINHIDEKQRQSLGVSIPEYLYETPITIDRSVPGIITITAGNETVNLAEP